MLFFSNFSRQPDDKDLEYNGKKEKTSDETCGCVLEYLKKT